MSTFDPFAIAGWDNPPLDLTPPTETFESVDLSAFARMMFADFRRLMDSEPIPPGDYIITRRMSHRPSEITFDIETVLLPVEGSIRFITDEYHHLKHADFRSIEERLMATLLITGLDLASGDDYTYTYYPELPAPYSEEPKTRYVDPMSSDPGGGLFDGELPGSTRAERRAAKSRRPQPHGTADDYRQKRQK